jgi:hypothetical protein
LISRETVQVAEHLKHVQGGFRDTELQARLTGIGFSRVEVHYEWFVGEGMFINRPEAVGFADELRSYLREMLPLTRHLFKYVSIVAVK